MFCSKCGNEVMEGSSFCGKCGNPVKQSSTQFADPTAFAEAASNSAPAGTVTAKKKPVLPIVLAVVVIAVIGVAIFAGGFGLLGLVSPKETVEEYTWKELSIISSKIAEAADEDEVLEIAKKYNLVNEDGTLDGTQTKSVTLTDGTETSVQIAGFAHDDKSDGSGKAGITFIFTDAIAEMYINSDSSNTGGWESSDMRSWLASDGKALLPKELQDVLVAVDKSTNNVGYVEDTDDVSIVVTTTSDELWLFSLVEIAGEVDGSDFYDAYLVFYENPEYGAAIYNVEGSQYKLFRDCNVEPFDYSDILAKTCYGESRAWWERSPDPYSSSGFRCVSSNGYPYHSGGLLGIAFFADKSFTVVPGFCI